jgi:hypothetical protein
MHFHINPHKHPNHPGILFEVQVFPSKRVKSLCPKIIMVLRFCLAAQIGAASIRASIPHEISQSVRLIMFRLFIVLVTFYISLAEIVQIQVISRHCSRTPIYEDGVPNFPINWYNLFHLGEGQLTELGQRRCHGVGQRIHDRYLSDSSSNLISNISRVYSSDFKFYSTAYDRTIYSVSYIASAMFSETVQMGTVNISRPTPVFSNPRKNDVLLVMWDKCPKIDQKIAGGWTGAEWLGKKKTYSPFLQMLTVLIGNNQTFLENFLEISDEILMAKEHGILDPALDQYYDKIVEIANYVQYFNYSRGMMGNLGGNYHRNSL